MNIVFIFFPVISTFLISTLGCKSKKTSNPEPPHPVITEISTVPPTTAVPPVPLEPPVPALSALSAHPKVRMLVNSIDSDYNLFEYFEPERDANGQIKTSSKPNQIKINKNRSVNKSKIIYWQKSQFNSDALSMRLVNIQIKLTCEATHFTKWEFNSDNEIANPNELLDMDYSVQFKPRYQSDLSFKPFTNQERPSTYYTEWSELTIKSFHPHFKSVSIDCVSYNQKSLRSRLYIFQRFTNSEESFRDARGEYLKLTQGALIPCKVHDPDVHVRLWKRPKNARQFTDVTSRFHYDWTHGFVPLEASLQYEHGEDYSCLLNNGNSVIHRFYHNPQVPELNMTTVAIQIPKRSSNQKLDITCSLNEAQRTHQAPFVYNLRSLRIESCDSPDYCHYTREDVTNGQQKICQPDEKNQCTFEEDDFPTEKLKFGGKVTCYVKITHKIYASHAYYFRGLSNKYYLKALQSPHEQPQVKEVLQVEVEDAKPEKINQQILERFVFCTALHFVTLGSNTMVISIVYKNGAQKHVWNPPLRFDEKGWGWRRGLNLKLTQDIQAFDCHVPWYNSYQWISTTHVVTDDERPRPPSEEVEPTVREKEAEVLPQPPNVAIASSLGIIFFCVFILVGYFMHRFFTIVSQMAKFPGIWGPSYFYYKLICCRRNTTSEPECHELLPMKSKLTNFEIPPRYTISSKDLSVDYSQVVSQGQFSTLYQGHLKLIGKRSVLVKINRIAGNATEIAFLMNDIQMRILAGETNERITSIIGAYFDRTAEKVYIAMQSNTKRNMREFLTNKNMPMGQMKILNKPPHEMVQSFCIWLQGVSQGLEFLHNQKIVHGNLAAENILVCLQNTNSVNITGFSHSQQLIGNASYFVKSRSWSTGWETSGWRWMPMESLRYMEFSKESDIWSFGVLMWEIFSLGAIPYSKYGYSNLSMEFIQKLEFGSRLLQPQLASKEIYQKMESCWSRYGKDRPKASHLSGYFKQDQSNLVNYVNLAK